MQSPERVESVCEAEAIVLHTNQRYSAPFLYNGQFLCFKKQEPNKQILLLDNTYF